VTGAAALLGALALAAGDLCLVTDEAGRTFRACFDPGNRLELAGGGRAGAGSGPAEGGALEAAAAWRWRGDTATPGGAPEWLRDQTVLEAAGLWRGGRAERGETVAWRGVFVRRLASPFILLPGPRPLRLPFPFDVGMAVQAGGVRWERDRRDALALEVVRSTLLLDVARHLGGVRRAAFGPEVAYGVSVARGRAPVHAVIPFTAGALEVLAESADGIWLAALSARAGGVLRPPAGLAGFASGTLRLERVVLAVNDVPLAVGLAVAGSRGGGPARLEAAALLRLGLDGGR